MGTDLPDGVAADTTIASQEPADDGAGKGFETVDSEPPPLAGEPPPVEGEPPPQDHGDANSSPSTETERPADPHGSLRRRVDGQPLIADDPIGLANQITLAETALDAGIAIDDMAHLQQAAYRKLSLHPQWDAAVYERIPLRYRPLAATHVAARRFFLTYASRPADIPAWTIGHPESAANLRSYYDEAERTFGVTWTHLAALHLVSTGFGRIVASAPDGPQGPFQFLPSTWERWGNGGDPQDTRDSVLAAARFLVANDWATDRRAALLAYNDNAAYVDGVLAYVAILDDDPARFEFVHAWQIYYLSASGDLWLPPGFEASEPVPAALHRPGPIDPNS